MEFPEQNVAAPPGRKEASHGAQTHRHSCAAEASLLSPGGSRVLDAHISHQQAKVKLRGTFCFPNGTPPF